MDEATKQFIITENEKLATMVAKGFADVHQKMDQGFADVDKRFVEVNERLTRIEQSVEYHGADIARLTDDMRLVKTAVGIA